jgi:protoheme IX farnesyltransferase
VLPSVQGLRSAKVQAVFYTALLVPASLMLFTLHVAGKVYLGVAVAMNAAYLGVALMGMKESAGRPWARQLFGVSLVYLTVLFAAMMVDAA